MSRKEREKAKSLDALARIAYAAGSAPAPPTKPAPPRAAPARPAAPPRATAAKPGRPADTEADRKRRAQLAERREKLEEEKRLRDRRASELVRNQNLSWRGSGFTDIPASIRRTGFDREEPSVSQKLHDILGDAREKEGRAKAREKGKRSGGRA